MTVFLFMAVDDYVLRYKYTYRERGWPPTCIICEEAGSHDVAHSAPALNFQGQRRILKETARDSNVSKACTCKKNKASEPLVTCDSDA